MNYWEPVTDKEIDNIHEAACQILEELGMRIREPKAIEVLVGAGARKVGDNIVQIPHDVIEKAIEAVPAKFTVYDRKGGAIVVGDNTYHHLNAGTMTEIIDYPDWQRREATQQDLRNITTIVDALDCVDMCIPMVEPRDVAKGSGEIISCAETLKNTTKFCWACPVEHQANEAFIEMAKALAQTDDLSKRPIVGMLATMVPGYEIDTESSKALMIAAREGVPVILMGASIMGAQGPETMASAAVMQAAEQLTGLCIVQTVREGSPCLWNCGSMKLDMKTAEIEEGGPDYNILIGAGAKLARKYGVPSYSCPASDSKIADFQGGFEMCSTLLTSLNAGIHVTVNAGAASKCSCGSYELLVFHNEMLRNLLRVNKGMTVNRETLAVDIMKEVGIRGDYLSHPSTMKWIRQSDEYLAKEIFDNSGVRAEYEDPCVRAQAKWKQILAEHKPAVSEEDKKAIDGIVAKYTA